MVHTDQIAINIELTCQTTLNSSQTLLVGSHPVAFGTKQGSKSQPFNHKNQNQFLMEHVLTT